MRAADIVPGADYAVGNAVPLPHETWRDVDPNADRVTVLDDRLWRALQGVVADAREHDLTHGPRSVVAASPADGVVTRGSLVVCRYHHSGVVRAVPLRRLLRPWDEHARLAAVERDRQAAARQRAAEREADEYADLNALRDRLKDILGGAPSLHRPAHGRRSVVIRDEHLAALLALAETSPAAPEEV